MNQFSFQADIPSRVEKQIQAELRGIEDREKVRILFAIESGSRAWGFPSPDSDFDVRFVYARPVDWYLTISPGRDVIELPIDDELDISGWDIRKALHLLIKPNAVLMEWMSSPIRYRWAQAPCERLIAFSSRVTHGPACLYHYLHLGERQWRVYVDGKTQVKLKKYFYIVRPALALNWMRVNPGVAPPMNFQELLAGLDLSEPLLFEFESMLERKKATRELGEAPRVKVIDDFITDQFEWARAERHKIATKPQKLKAEADEIFRSIVKETS